VWRRSAGGHLELIRETNTPDEFPTPEQYDEMLAAIKERPLARHQVVTISALHNFYLAPQFIEHSSGLRTVTATFSVVNLRRDGSASQYWTQPVTITLPDGCSVN